MADIQNGDPARAQLSNRAKQPVDASALETARRFVHQDQPGICRESSADLDHLARRRRQIAYHCIGWDFGTAEFREKSSRTLTHCFALNKTEVRRFAA